MFLCFNSYVLGVKLFQRILAPSRISLQADKETKDQIALVYHRKVVGVVCLQRWKRSREKQMKFLELNGKH